jgi:hypothetical protein
MEIWTSGLYQNSTCIKNCAFMNHCGTVESGSVKSGDMGPRTRIQRKILPSLKGMFHPLSNRDYDKEGLLLNNT